MGEHLAGLFGGRPGHFAMRNGLGNGSSVESSFPCDVRGYSRQGAGFGFGWGIGSVLFGLGLNRLGLAVGYGIIIGLIAPIGTFLPFWYCILNACGRGKVHLSYGNPIRTRGRRILCSGGPATRARSPESRGNGAKGFG